MAYDQSDSAPIAEDVIVEMNLQRSLPYSSSKKPPALTKIRAAFLLKN